MASVLKILLSALLAILSMLRSYVRTVIFARKLPGPPTAPLMGNIEVLKKAHEIEQFLKTAPQTYGPIFRVWMAIVPAVFICEPKHLKLILSTNKNNQKSLYYRALHNFLGQGLITNNGEKWKMNRKMIQPYFHINILETFVDTFTESSCRLIDTLHGERTVNITSIINECVLDILHNAILGVTLDKNSPYRKGEFKAIGRFEKPWLMFESLFNWTSSATSEQKQKQSLYSYTEEILAERRRESKKQTKPCFLDMFIEIADNNTQFTEADIIKETVTFMLAGQDSVGATLAFILFQIAKHQDVQDKIFAEISKFNDKDKLSLQELNEMVYLEQVIKEVMRLLPAVPVISRVLTEDVQIDDLLFPSGTILLISPFITHRLPQVFPDPDKFDPDRFSESNIENIHPFAYFPFSLGPRNCIGYKFAIIELKTVLFYLLHKFKLTVPPGKEDLSLVYRATLRAKGGIWISLSSRKS